MGDWLAPQPICSNTEFVSSVCFVWALDIAIFFAQTLGEDVSALKRLKKNVISAVNATFFNPETANYCNGVQGENVLALRFGLVPSKYVAQLRQKVVEAYKKTGCLDTGILATPALLDVLTELDPDLTMKIMTRNDYPSYFYLMNGETTLCEHWSKKWPSYKTADNGICVNGGGDVSHSHFVYGSALSWLYKKVAGLDLSEMYRRCVKITPSFVDILEFAQADAETPYGRVFVKWQNKDAFKMEICIPRGLTAEVCFKSDATKLKLSGGEEIVSDVDGKFCFTCVESCLISEESTRQTIISKNRRIV